MNKTKILSFTSNVFAVLWVVGWFYRTTKKVLAWFYCSIRKVFLALYSGTEKTREKKHIDLNNKAIELKEEGNLVAAIKCLDEAEKLFKTYDVIILKSNYLYENNQRDLGWQLISDLHMETQSSFMGAKEWDSVLKLFNHYVRLEEEMVKLLNKENKLKDVAFHLPGATYLRLLQHLLIGDSDSEPVEDFLNNNANVTISDFMPNTLSEFNLDAYNETYKSCLLSKRKEIIKFAKLMQSKNKKSKQSMLTKQLKELSFHLITLNEKCHEAIKT